MALLYTRMKAFHYPEKLRSLPREEPRILPPIHVRIKPTNVCGHNCYYCAYRADALQLGEDMNLRDLIPREKMREIIADLAEMGVKAVTFSGGGDPFCYPHLLETAQQLARSPIHFASLTNGARLEGEVAEVFARHATWLRISIDGWDDRSYAEYRGVREGEFSKVLRNVAAFKKLGGACYLGAAVIVDQKNVEHVFELTARLKDLGVDSVKICPCIVSNKGRENNAYHQPIFERVKAQTDRAQTELSGSGFEVYDAYHLLEETFDKGYTWCPYLQVITVIGADQNVYACHDKAYNLGCGLLGSIKQRRFKDFWMHDKSKFYAINPSVHCNHHCEDNMKNKMVLEFLEAHPDHLGFV